VAIPIKIRGQTVGSVTVKLKENYSSATVTTVVQAIERLSGSLESARLFEEARQRAEHEQAISQVTSAISSAVDFDEILRVAVEQIGRSLGDSQISIQVIDDTEQARTSRTS
jgi:GAF domain-containing protein